MFHILAVHNEVIMNTLIFIFIVHLWLSDVLRLSGRARSLQTYLRSPSVSRST